jgi:hypothetical protein
VSDPSNRAFVWLWILNVSAWAVVLGYFWFNF